MTPEPHILWVCRLCSVYDHPVWVGDYDAVDLLGACPHCSHSAGIQRLDQISHHMPEVAVAKAAHLAGTFDRLDERAGEAA